MCVDCSGGMLYNWSKGYERESSKSSLATINGSAPLALNSMDSIEFNGALFQSYLVN